MSSIKTGFVNATNNVGLKSGIKAVVLIKEFLLKRGVDVPKGENNL